MIPLEETQAPPDPKQLLGMLKEPVKSLVTNDVEEDASPERMWVLRQMRKSGLYWRGLQYVAPYLFDSGYTEFSQVGSPISQAGPDQATGLYDYNQNIYRGYGRKFCAVLGQRSPNVKAVADDPGDDAVIKAARVADTAAAILRAKWDVDVKNMELSMYMWTDGTSFGYTPYVKNGRKYGYSSEPRLEVRDVAIGPPTYHCVQCGADTPENQVDPLHPVCPQCGTPFTPESYREAETMQSPVPVGVIQYENGGVELELLNYMFVSVPFFCKTLEDAPWLSYDYEVHKGKLLQMYPELRETGSAMDNQGSDSSSSSVAEQTRNTAASPLGIPTPHRSNRWNYRRVWLRPEMFELVKDGGLRKTMTDNYPDGMKVTMVQGRVVELENENLSDVWAYCKPETSEFIYADGIGFDLLPVQDMVNDCSVNLPAETIERGLGVTVADPRVIDVDQWSQKSAKAAEIVPAMATVGDTLSNAFFQIPPTKFSDQIMPWGAAMIDMGIKNVGTVDQIFGGGNAETARQAEINKNAAMMQLGTTWLYCRKFWEKVYKNGVTQLSRWGAGTIRHGSFVVDLSELKDAGYHFEADEAMPMTWAQQRDFIMWLLEKPPQLLDAYGVTHPMNVERNKSLLGMTDYYTPGLDEYDKAMDTIQKLSQGKPIQKPAPDGSVQVMPSIPTDDFLDDAATMVKIVIAYCNSAPGRRLAEDNPDGLANVVAWGKAYADMMPDPNAPPPPPPPKLSFSAKLPLDANQAQQILNSEGIQTPPPTGPVTNAHGQVEGPPMLPPPDGSQPPGGGAPPPNQGPPPPPGNFTGIPSSKPPLPAPMS